MTALLNYCYRYGPGCTSTERVGAAAPQSPLPSALSGKRAQMCLGLSAQPEPLSSWAGAEAFIASSVPFVAQRC